VYFVISFQFTIIVVYDVSKYIDVHFYDFPYFFSFSLLGYIKENNLKYQDMSLQFGEFKEFHCRGQK